MSKRFEHDHLHRLQRIWVNDPVYLITCATESRRPILASSSVHDILVEVWNLAPALYGWQAGDYVIMPDHVHFFCSAIRREAKPLGVFCRKWKEWMAKNCQRRLGWKSSLWQGEFHDWLVRSEEDLCDKQNYVRLNPVRKGLVKAPDDWPYRGCLNVLGLR